LKELQDEASQYELFKNYLFNRAPTTPDLQGKHNTLTNSEHLGGVMSRAVVFCSLVFGLFLVAVSVQAQQLCPGSSTVSASVVALDQVVVINRLGTVRPAGMIYALRSDVEPINGTDLSPGNVRLKPDRRPRPLVLRVHEGECLKIAFQNLLHVDAQPDPKVNPNDITSLQAVTRNASIHVTGMQLVTAITDDGTYVGANPMAGANFSGVVPPGGNAVYTVYAAARGSYLIYSTPGDFNAFNNPPPSQNEQLTLGLFGAVNVEPPGTEWYRSQTSHEDFLRAAHKVSDPQSLGGYRYEINYDAEDSSGKPVLKMLDKNNQIVYGDLTAVITGPHHGMVPPQPENPALPHREYPYREITIHYHESQDVVQAFPWAYDPANNLIADVNAGLDGFAINYGAAGITPEVLANRLQLGPARDCQDCKFEEFFLSSWADGDPAMVVDNPANLPCANVPPDYEMLAITEGKIKNPCTPANSPRATKAFYPDDPSNVYHSYLGDHVQFQILHAGAAVHHVHHHHAHQWVHTPDSPDSSYLDSQAIGPGSSFTLDLVYQGSGNLNLTTGDSIFHCHFYPHFAAGMWALFRVHDVFEEGTELDSNGRPKPGSRALPDAEIKAGTPIPAVIPLPTQGMAPMPEKVEIVDGQVHVMGKGHPGYPFFVPGIAGHRPPHPPLDFAKENGDELNGGLPRHIVRSATIVNEQHSTTDFSKDIGLIQAIQLPEEGTAEEKTAMGFFGQRAHKSFTPLGAPADFIVNGLPRKSQSNPTGAQSGAPFADPGVDENGKAVGDLINGQPRRYKGVNLQIDTVLNKKGWHYPQQRMIALWDDVEALRNGNRAPEPFFFRASAGDLVEYWHSNLVPAYYELDDFQVRTPTDILGQHIHLVKFDVLASDGAANGFNYEDGTFSPDEVRSRIAGINETGGLCTSFECSSRTMLKAKAIRAFGNGPQNTWLGAQATVQRWYVDSMFSTEKNDDRTYLTIFTHDHFGPSTHQEAGLYGGLLVEPRCSAWTSPDGKEKYGTRDDGGPTSYAANIVPAANLSGCKPVESYREFALAWGDLQLVYQPTSKSQPDCYPGQTPATANCKAVAPGAAYTGWADPANTINCPGCSLTQPASGSPPYVTMNGNFGYANSPPTPRLVSDFGNGVFSMNYRAEPLPLRVFVPPTGGNPAATSLSSDLSHVFRSIPRSDQQMSTQPKAHSLLDPSCQGTTCFKFPVECHSPHTQPGPEDGCGVLPADPYTPLFRAYEGDNVQVRVLAGAHTSMHDFTLHGMKWFFEPFNKDSGYRNSQFVILSEHYEMLFKMPPVGPNEKTADYIYNPSASFEGLVNGDWGLLRSYKSNAENLARLPNNSAPSPAAPPISVPPGTPQCSGSSVEQVAAQAPCLRTFRIAAVSARQVFGNQNGLVYNSRGARTTPVSNDPAQKQTFGDNPLYDPDALVYVLEDDKGNLLPPKNPEPLVLRANAGDWIQIKLTNRLDPNDSVFKTNQQVSRVGQYTTGYNSIPVMTSTSVGLHPQLVAFDVTKANGINAGLNPVQTATPKNSVDYLWYAGDLQYSNGKWNAQPIEFGAINLLPSDPLSHVYHGLFGALVIEPKGSAWRADTDYRASATVFPANGGAPFREFVIMAQDDINMLVNNQSLYAANNNLSAFNYRSEPFFYRFGTMMNKSMKQNAPADWSKLTSADLANLGAYTFSSMDTTLATSDTLVAGDPETPIFRAPAGMPVRFRLVDPGGIGDNQQVFELTGHVWEEEPFQQNSTVLGHNPRSQYSGTTAAYGPTSHYNILIDSAGGANKIAGDYRYRSWTANQYQVGMWGLFRVGPSRCTTACPDTVTISSVQGAGGNFVANGVLTISPQTKAFASHVAIRYGEQSGRAAVNPSDGTWSFSGVGPIPDSLRVLSNNGGSAVYQNYAAQAQPPLPRSIQAKPKQKRKDTRR
jgi:manganese oxidase